MHQMISACHPRRAAASTAAALLTLLLVALPSRAKALGTAATTPRAAYSALIAREAGRQGIPAALAEAVASVESGWDPTARGTSGEVGLMQVMPPTAAVLGFRGTLEQLADPETNIRIGVEYLRGAWTLAGGDLCTTLMKYRAGHGETAMSLRSQQYCQRARRYLAAVGSPLADGPDGVVTPLVLVFGPAASRHGSAPQPDLLTSAEWLRLRAGRRTAADSQRFWMARAALLRTQRTRFYAGLSHRHALTRYAGLLAPRRFHTRYAQVRHTKPPAQVAAQVVTAAVPE